MQELKCSQVISLLTYYIEGKLTLPMCQSIEFHLSTCVDCRKKYLKLKQILSNYSDIKNKIEEDDDESTDEELYNTHQYKVFKNMLSAYVDNELSDSENLRIKKIAIANPLARRDLENIYAFKQLLQTSFEKTKSDMKYDFVKNTLKQLPPRRSESYKINLQFYKLVSIFALLLTFIIWGAFNFLK